MDFKKCYSYDDKVIMKAAQDSLNRSNDRIQEIIAFAKQSNYKKIGIAFCTSLTKEADVFKEILLSEGFQVETVNCKYGKMPFADLWDDYKGTSCNPVGQALFLKEKNTELNVVMGLCLGHDMIFNAKSKAPVTTLIVKDRKLKHRTIERLNTS
jgi:uncharacterized metal-binding protein